MNMSYERKVTCRAEEHWMSLGGYHYDGIHATPERYYAEITQAIFVQEDAEILAVDKIIERRTQELTVLAQEVQDIQDMLSHSLNHRAIRIA